MNMLESSFGQIINVIVKRHHKIPVIMQHKKEERDIEDTQQQFYPDAADEDRRARPDDQPEIGDH
jgi:hypothetical protein